MAANSVSVLRDMLASVCGDNPGAVNDETVSELSEQCRAMRPRVVALVNSVGWCRFNR